MSEKSFNIKKNFFVKVEYQEASFYRSYYQILALWGTIPQSELSNAENKPIVESFDITRGEIETAFNGNSTGFDPVIMSSALYKLEAALIELIPIEDLIFRLEAYRDEFRTLAGEESFFEYTNSVGYKRSIKGYSDNANEKYIRADANYLISQIQRFSTLLERAESTRTFLLSKLWKYTLLMIAPLSIPILIFFADLVYLRHTTAYAQLYNPTAAPTSAPVTVAPVPEPASPDSAQRRTESGDAGSAPEESPTVEPVVAEQYSSEPDSMPGENVASVNITRLALLCFVGIAGAIGAFVSALNRIQQLKISQDLSRHSLVIRNAASQLKWSPITGIIFAEILSLIFLGGLIQGGIFPSGGSWTLTLYTHNEFAKLLIWGFIGGFSERFVPDLLDRFISSARQGESGGGVGTSIVRATNVRLMNIEEEEDSSASKKDSNNKADEKT